MSTAVDQALLELFQDLSRQHGMLTGLDGFAMRRIPKKGPNIDHLKGQVLEELLQSRVVPLSARPCSRPRRSRAVWWGLL
jgi:hypothetical protein